METREIARLLPEIIRGTATDRSPLAGLIAAMAGLLDPVDRRLGILERYFDPFRAPTAMLPYLAHWVDLGWIPVAEGGGGEGVAADDLRALIAMAPALARGRGTKTGLEQALRAVTKIATIRVREADSRERPFHLYVEIPRSRADAIRLVETVVRAERPAHLTHETMLVD